MLNVQLLIEEDIYPFQINCFYGKGMDDLGTDFMKGSQQIKSKNQELLFFINGYGTARFPVHNAFSKRP